MKVYNTYLNLFFAFASMPCALAMMPEADRDLRDPMEIDEPAHDNRQDRVATLQQTCLKYAVSHLPGFVKNPKIISLDPDLRGEIYDRWMFGENPAEMHRNQSIIWLMAQCPAIKCDPCQFDRSLLARPLTECNNMRISLNNDSSGFIVEDVRAQEGLFQFVSEGRLAYAQFSPDGRHMFIAAKDKQIAIMSTQDWEVVHEGELQQCLFYNPKFIMLNPKNLAVMSGSRTMLKLYDTITGDPLCDVIRHSENMITEAEFSVDGDRVYVLYDIEEEIGDENSQDSLNAPPQAGIMADVYDISAANKILHLLPTLTLEQLAALELCHKIATEEKVSEDQFAQATEQYKALPEEIRAVVACPLPGMAQETALKRRKIDGSANLE